MAKFKGYDLARGFTLLEILISVAIIILLASLALISFSGSRQVQNLATQSQNLLATLRLAQAKTLSGEENSVWGVRLETFSFILFRGPNFTSATSTQIYELPSGLEISEWNFNGGGQEIVFKRVNGSTVQFGTITMSASGVFSQSVLFQIDSSGKVYLSGVTLPPAGTRIIDVRHRNFSLGWSIKDSSELSLVFSDSPNPDTTYPVSTALYFNGDKTSFDWSGEIPVGGQTQKLRIHTVLLSDSNTVLSIDRDCRQNSKKVKIYIDTKDIATYEADCLTVAAGLYGGEISEP